MSLKKVFVNSLSENIDIHQKLVDLLPEVNLAIKIIFKKLKMGGKLLLCGNGGSASDAQHLAAEYLVRLRPQVDRKPLPALTLAQDTSTITACGNDYLFDDIFLRPFQALANKNDILICLSTSGNSKNVILAVQAAKALGMKTIVLTGKDGGKLAEIADLEIRAPHSDYADRAQEIHIKVIHALIDGIERTLEG